MPTVIAARATVTAVSPAVIAGCFSIRLFAPSITSASPFLNSDIAGFRSSPIAICRLSILFCNRCVAYADVFVMVSYAAAVVPLEFFSVIRLSLKVSSP